MTGFKSKRAAAQAKTIDQVNWADHELDDDDTQVYKDHDDTLTIAYQSGFFDGKKAAAQEPPQYSFKAYWAEDGRIGVVACIIRPDGGPHIMEEFIDPPHPAQEPWRESASDYERGFIDGMQKQSQSSVDKAVNAMTQPTYYIPSKDQRPWVGLTDEEVLQIRENLQVVEGISLLENLTKAIEARLKEKNT